MSVRRRPELPSAPAWRAAAACHHSNLAVFFPAGRDEESETQIAQARLVCGGCAVRTLCLQAGLDEPFGVWGGTTEEERRELRRARRATGRMPVPEIDLRSV